MKRYGDGSGASGTRASSSPSAARDPSSSRLPTACRSTPTTWGPFGLAGRTATPTLITTHHSGSAVGAETYSSKDL